MADGTERDRVRSRILVVDDDPLLVRALARTLTHAGHVVQTAGSVARAREEIAGPYLDAVLTDIGLPDGTGLEVLAAARDHDPRLPVVVLTGEPELSTAVTALESGALRYLTKPIETSVLLATIDLACQQRHMSTRVCAQHPDGCPYMEPARLAEACRRFNAALDGLYMMYQPVASWSERRVVAYEALLRSTEPTLSRPDLLLAAAEHLGRVRDVGRTVRRRVAASVGPIAEGCDVYVNLHPAELADEDLYDPAAPLSAIAHRVVLEITERSSLDHLEDAAERIAALRALGYRIAIDDLGAGYASLSTLAMIRPDLVKLDMTLVRGVGRDPARQMMLRSLNQLCVQLGITTVTEGVETADELVGSLQAGGDLMQGYLFGRPHAQPPEVDFERIGIAAGERRAAVRPGTTAVMTAAGSSPWRSLDDLALTLCHDVRIPLDGLVGAAHELRRGGPLSTEDRAGIADQILRHTAQIDTLVGTVVGLVDGRGGKDPAQAGVHLRDDLAIEVEREVGLPPS
jgi:EAL domain-containing protein (putative c-di-GMP-specific phosphodiesterase class I)/ActR/RegA family two-component response regulator